MRAEHLDPLWNRILEIQASEEGSERFTFRQWWDPASKRYFKTRYAGETDDEGDGAPVPTKKGKKSSKSRSRPLPAGLARLAASTVPVSSSKAAEAGAPSGTQGPAKPGRPAKHSGGQRSSSKTKRRSKGKGRARDSDEDSARFTEGDGSNDSSDDDGQGAREDASPKPKHKPKPRPRRKEPLPHGDSDRIENTSEASDVPQDLERLGANAPLGAAAEVTVPPASGLIARLQHRPPSAVRDPGEVFGYLWALSGEAAYRNLLTSWRHMVSPIYGFGHNRHRSSLCNRSSAAPLSFEMMGRGRGRRGRTAQSPSHRRSMPHARHGSVCCSGSESPARRRLRPRVKFNSGSWQPDWRFATFKRRTPARRVSRFRITVHPICKVASPPSLTQPQSSSRRVAALFILCPP